MGVIRVTRRPYYYAQMEEEEKLPPKPTVYPSGTLAFRFSVGGINSIPSYQQKYLKKVISAVLKERGHFVRDKNPYGSLGYYDWGKVMLDGNLISTGNFDINHLDPILDLMKELDARGLFPEDEIMITYHPEDPNLMLLFNLTNIIESRRPLIEEALSLTEPFLIVCSYGFALSIKLGAFSYTAVEATAYLIAQACKMAAATGKSRMKPCDMTNPKFQMRSWLLRLGFIGEQFERPRRTLLEGLSGDAAFFREDQKNQAVARRKAKSMNGGKQNESA